MRWRDWREAGAQSAIITVALTSSRRRSARALLGLADRHGDKALERACAKALTWTARPSYKTVKTALQKIEADRGPDPEAGAYRRPEGCYDQFDPER